MYMCRVLYKKHTYIFTGHMYHICGVFYYRKYYTIIAIYIQVYMYIILGSLVDRDYLFNGDYCVRNLG